MLILTTNHKEKLINMEEKIPFVYPLSSPNGKYIYDVNTNEVISISEEVFEALNKILKKQKFQLEPAVQNEIEAIKNMGYLSDNKVEQIEHPALPFLRTFLERKVQKITLQVTQGCNLRCTYCIYSETTNEKQRVHSSKRMSFDTAKQAVNFLLNHSIDCEKVNIGFYGGEPLLEFDLIKKIVLYAESVFIGKDLDFSLTSNGTLLTDEIIEFFIDHNVNLMISIDGPKEIHDNSRVFAKDGSGTFDTILHNLEDIHEKYPNYIEKISINTVINPQNDYSCIDSLFINYNLFKDMNLSSSIIDDTYTSEKLSLSSNFIENSNYQTFLAFLSKFNRIEKKYISPMAQQEVDRLDSKIDNMYHNKSLPLKSAPSGPCIPGQLRLFINVDGNFYPCERVSETSNLMQIGNLIDGFNYDKAGSLLNIGSLTPNECRNCWAFQHCSLCGRHADDDNILSRELKLSYCNSVRNALKNDLECIILFNEINRIYK